MLCVLGLLVVFLRRIPEVVHEKGQMALDAENAELNFKALSKKFGNVAWDKTKFFSSIFGKKVWHFMLEAKDLKQGQILAAKFAHLVKPRSKVLNIGAFNSIKKADRLIEEDKNEEAEQILIAVIRKHPHEYLAYESLLRIYFKQKKFDDVTEILEFLVAHNPTNHSYWAQLGNVMLSTRRFKEAIEAYQKSLELNALVPARFVNLGLAQQAAGDLENARKNFQQGVDLDPSNMQYLMILVDTMVRLGEREKAIEALKKANERDPENVEIKEKIISLEGN